jgi:hypothetical protein
MKCVTAVITLCSLVVPALVLIDSNAWSGCTIEQRIELGNQGYDKGEVEKACSDSGDDFWNSMSKTLRDTVSAAASRGLDKAFGGGATSQDALSATKGASMCETNYGRCPLRGPVGYPCYCRDRNGNTFQGILK